MTLSDMLDFFGGAVGNQEPNILQYEPNEVQEEFHKNTKMGRILWGSNRSGKSVAGATESIYRLRGDHPYQRVPPAPVIGRVITTNLDYGADEIIIPKLIQWTPPSMWIDGSWTKSYHKSTGRFTFANGSRLEIKTHNQRLDTFAGTARDFLWVDEECPKDIFLESKARLIDKNGKFWLTMTPVEGLTWVYDDFIVGNPFTTATFNIKIKDNVHLDPDAIAEYERDLDDIEKAIRVDGHMVPRAGYVFKQFDGIKHVVKAGTPPKSWPVYVSMDSGFTNPTAVYWHAVAPDGMVVTFHEHYRSGWTAHQHAAEIHKINKYLGVKPLRYIGDPSMAQRTPHTGLSLLLQYRREGIPVMAGDNEIRGGLDRMNDYLNRHMWWITDNCPNLIREMKRYAIKQLRSRKLADRTNPMEQPQKKDDHGPDACRYFYNSMINPENKYSQRDGRDKILNALKAGLQPPQFPWKVDTGLLRTKERDWGWGEV